jgi:Flp pilus assembly protein TadD
MSLSHRGRPGLATAALAVLAAATFAGDAQAFPFQKPAAQHMQVSGDQLDQIQRALDERRLVDAGQLIDQVLLAGVTDPRVHLLAGELGLARGRYDAAIQAFRLSGSKGTLSPQAMQGEALALAQLGRRDEAVGLLKKVVAQDPQAWRAWNALGAEYDGAQSWDDAGQAYEHAISSAPNAAVPLNNRGYSRLLQGRLDAAVADFVAALEKQPDFAEARANLRLALALRGEYDRAIDGSSDRDRAALLNNAGLAAAARGDFVKAEALLNKAIELKGEFYQRASDNLSLVRTLASRTQGPVDAAR